MDGLYGPVEVLMRCRVINEPGRLLSLTLIALQADLDPLA